MNQIQSTLVHKILPPRNNRDSHHPTLMLLHGRGASEDDLLGLAEYLDERLFIISPRAPFEFPWGGGFTWYEILEVGRPEPAMFAESYSKLVQFLEDALMGYPVDPKRFFILGFSMGTMMSYAMLLTKPVLVAGVVANSGYVPEETGLVFRWNSLAGKSLFIAHGLYDPVIPVQFGRRSKELFTKTEAEVLYTEYPMGHQISETSLSDFSLWLTKRLDGSNPPSGASL